MGFSHQLTSILNYLPSARQTMLFSATQTKSIKDLARLSLKDPEYVAVHEKSEHATPATLIQNYITCELQTKLDVLYSFIKTHLKHKIIIFVSTCRQVRFMYEAFCKMQPGVPLLALHGKYKQAKRVDIYYDFLNKPAAVMFATDIASRGLDFPAVDWVVQYDCPEDAATYIHRAGRTARFNKTGRALLFLLPSENEMVEELSLAKIPITKIKMNPKQNHNTQTKFASLVAAHKDLKALAQKAFMSYVRSVHLQPKKNIFNASSLSLQEFALSLGLAGAPRVNFIEISDDRSVLREKKNVNRKLHNLKTKIKEQKELKRLEKRMAKDAEERQQKNDTDSDSSEEEESVEKVEEDTFLQVKRVHDWTKEDSVQEVAEDDEEEEVQPQQKKAKKMKIRVDADGMNKMTFDDDGVGSKMLEIVEETAMDKNHANELVVKSKSFVEKVAIRLKEGDAADRAREKDRVREKHTKKRQKQKGLKEEDEEESMGVSLGGADSDSGSGSDEDDASDDEMDPEAMALAMLEARNNQ